MALRLRAFASLLAEAAARWRRHGAPGLAAGLAFYALLSLAPLLLIAVAVAGSLFGAEAARGEIVSQVGTAIGPDAASVAASLLTAAGQGSVGVRATVIGIVLLLFGASNVFTQLRVALNTVAEAGPGRRGIVAYVRDRLVASFLVFLAGGLLIATMVAGALLPLANTVVARFVPGAEVSRAGHHLTMLALTAGLSAVIYRVLPARPAGWRAAGLGAAFTAILVWAGSLITGAYLTARGIHSLYGAAGSVVFVLLWTYYAAQAFLFGAEFTFLYDRRRSGPGPSREGEPDRE
ncbi:MAG: YihY/virulence factor BrkB family protein [Anaerolineae bacterium]